MGVLTLVESLYSRCPIWPCMLNGIASSIIIVAAIRFVWIQYFRSGKAR